MAAVDPLPAVEPRVSKPPAALAAARLCLAAACVSTAQAPSGWQTRAAAMALAVFTVLATLAAHPFWNLAGAAFQHEFTTALEHLAIVGGFVLLMLRGREPAFPPPGEKHHDQFTRP